MSDVSWNVLDVSPMVYNCHCVVCNEEKELHTYSKEIQTTSCLAIDQETDMELSCNELISQENVNAFENKKNVENLKSQTDSSSLCTNETMNASLQTQKKEKEKEKNVDVDVDHIIQNSDFNEFLSTTSKWMERALYESSHYDMLLDYGADMNCTNQESLETDILTLQLDFKRERSGSVTDLDFSSKFSELLLASYKHSHVSNSNNDASVLVWNQHNPNTPEYTFNSSSDVLKAAFVKYSPQLIVGTTYSGQVLVWDIRSKSDPIIKSGFSTQGHAHPIHSMAFVGSHNVMTASSDGLVCCWQLDMMNMPVESLPLSLPSQSRIDQVAVTCLAFPKDESAKFWVGSEQGLLYQANRFDRASLYVLHSLLFL